MEQVRAPKMWLKPSRRCGSAGGAEEAEETAGSFQG